MLRVLAETLGILVLTAATLLSWAFIAVFVVIAVDNETTKQ